MRVHHIDLRSIKTINNSLDQFFWGSPDPFRFTLTRGSEHRGYLESRYELKENIIKAMDYLLTIDREENRYYFLSIFYEFNKLGFGLNGDELLSWEHDYFEIIEKELGKLDESIIDRNTLILNLRETYHREMRKHKGTMEVLLSQLTLIPIDIYTLCRMFIRFDDKPNSICNRPTIDNVIVYTGAHHTEIYEDFLNITFRTPAEIKITNRDISDLCLQIGEFDYWQ